MLDEGGAADSASKTPFHSSPQKGPGTVKFRGLSMSGRWPSLSFRDDVRAGRDGVSRLVAPLPRLVAGQRCFR